MYVHSSNAIFEIDRRGFVLSIDDQDAHDPDSEAATTIDRFDLAEYAATYGEGDATDFDILDLGYWYTDADGRSGYEPPSGEFRIDYQTQRVLDRLIPSAAK